MTSPWTFSHCSVPAVTWFQFGHLVTGNHSHVITICNLYSWLLVSKKPVGSHKSWLCNVRLDIVHRVWSNDFSLLRLHCLAIEWLILIVVSKSVLDVAFYLRNHTSFLCIHWFLKIICIFPSYLLDFCINISLIFKGIWNIVMQTLPLSCMD